VEIQPRKGSCQPSVVQWFGIKPPSST
jgi:hypothetical protein